MALSVSQIIREAKKVVRRKIPGFREKLTPETLRKNPFVCVMIQCGIVDGELTEEEKFLIRKVVRAAYSFVDGEIIDKILPKAIKQEIKNPTPLGDIIRYLHEKSVKAPYDAEYEDKLHLITFAYMVAMEDAHFNKREKQYINNLAKQLKVSDIDVNKIGQSVSTEFSVAGSKRVGNIYRNVAKFSLLDAEVLYNDPIFNLIVQVAYTQGVLSQEEREVIKTILCNIHDISRIAINNVFDRAVGKVIENPLNMEKLADELKESNVEKAILIKLAYLIAIKRETSNEVQKETINKISKLLGVNDDEIRKYIEEVKEHIQKQSKLDYMKDRDVFNSLNGTHVGVVIDETKNGKHWVVKEPNGLIYEIEKDKVFIRELD
jgi:uncharacterized membrane protein YebE (DUF533 family)